MQKRIETDDGYILIEVREECNDIEIKVIHEKGKVWYPKVKMAMGNSDVQFVPNTGINEETWEEVVHIPIFPYSILKEFLFFFKLAEKQATKE